MSSDTTTTTGPSAETTLSLQQLEDSNIDDLCEIYNQLIEDQYEQYSTFLEENNLSLIETLNQSGAVPYSGDLKRGLALSGGGVRGYITVLILEKLQNKLRVLKEDPTFNIVDEFDYLAGTSIGGIIALSLAHNLSVDKLKGLFVDHAAEIFNKSTWDKIPVIGFFFENGKRIFKGLFDVKPLEKQLQIYFEDKTLDQLALKKPVVVTAAGSNGVPVYFSNKNKSDLNTKIWEVARCTSAAPTYFDPHKLSNDPNPKDPIWYTDGGLFANNPSTVLAAIMTKDGIPLEKIYILSLGTGQVKVPKPAQLKALGYKSILTILNLVMDTTFRSIDLSMQMILAKNYLNINPMLQTEIDMADASKLPEMKAEFEKNGVAIDTQLDNYIKRFYEQ